MNINCLYDIAEREKIYIVNSKLKNTEGMYCCENNLKAIALDYSQLNCVKEKCVLAEELGHYYCNATYPLSCSDETLIRKAEYRAKKYQTKILVLPSDIERIKEKNLKYKWEIAEELNVTEEVAERAVAYYTVNERVI